MTAERKPLEPVYYRKDLAELFNISTRTLQKRLDELFIKHPNFDCLSRFIGKKQFFTYNDIEEIKQLCLPSLKETKVHIGKSEAQSDQVEK